MSEKKTVKKQTRSTKQPLRLYERFHWTQRVAHVLLLTSFSLLGITGLPQKFATSAWAQAMVQFFGGIETTRLIHHICAIVLMFLAIYHILDAGYKIFVLHTRLSMLPGITDVKDAFQAFVYNLGFTKKRPQMGRYTFEEKAEYWALIWGTVIMGITGFMMWNPITTARFLPGEIIPASKAAHGGEALLAVMAIVVWHMYGVHLKRFNKAMFTGKQTEEEMLHEHPLELADIKAGIAERPVYPKILRRRQTIYFPVAGVLAIAMLFGVYGFIGSEKTAITTVLPISNPVPIYVPQTPTPIPTTIATAVPPGMLTWDASIGAMFQTKCAMCHNASLPTNGLSFASYADALRGGNNGPVIVPSDATSSKLVVIQSAGGHPGQFSLEELTAVKNWIDAEALEK
ncbi:MAG: cytochrome b/b6 domain-containing protein [Planctomycetes bacterium]|nr:cytochrome b/b6 domain-containing protein [Planctomycetota bacterium]